jgi:sulfate adenylyltransferase subunit 1
MLVGVDDASPIVGQEFKIMCCWFNAQPMQLRKRYVVRSAVAETIGMVTALDYRVDIHTLEPVTGESTLNMNDIACLTLRTSNPMVFDRYEDNRTTGSLVLIDPDSNETIAAGMIG